MVELDGHGTSWSFCSLLGLENEDFRLIFFMLLHSKWEIFTSRRPIPMGSLDPHLSRSHIRGTGRFMSTCFFIALTAYCSPPQVQIPSKHHVTRTILRTYTIFYLQSPFNTPWPFTCGPIGYRNGGARCSGAYMAILLSTWP
jgi:hypothetical protein